jgi:hypothetical protein
MLYRLSYVGVLLRRQSGQGGSRTPERRRRADLQSASFGHLDTCPMINLRRARPPVAESRQSESNRRHFAYKANALPTELCRPGAVIAHLTLPCTDTLRGRQLLARNADIILTSTNLVKIRPALMRVQIVPVIVKVVKDDVVKTHWLWYTRPAPPALAVLSRMPLDRREVPEKTALRLSARG